MGNTVKCTVHGERREAFVCHHLVGNSFGLGFNRDEPADDDNPCPDAWCDSCEIIRASHNRWNDTSEKLVKISLICSACYERARIQNTKTAVTLNDLESLRWKCSSCEDWHSGPCLDFSYRAPYYWRNDKQATDHETSKPMQRPATFLSKDYCAIDNEHFFVCGVIHLPIIGTAETFRWGVWGSLSRENFEAMLRTDNDPKRVELAPMFSWLSNQIPEYPDTLNLKMYASIQSAKWRPQFELETTTHPLSQEYHHGISPERVKKIMMSRVREIH
jgi:hypothetical protein